MYTKARWISDWETRNSVQGTTRSKYPASPSTHTYQRLFSPAWAAKLELYSRDAAPIDIVSKPQSHYRCVKYATLNLQAPSSKCETLRWVYQTWPSSLEFAGKLPWLTWGPSFCCCADTYQFRSWGRLPSLTRWHASFLSRFLGLAQQTSRSDEPVCLSFSTQLLPSPSPQSHPWCSPQ